MMMKSEKEKYLKELQDLEKYSKYAILGVKDALNLSGKKRYRFENEDAFEVYKSGFCSVLYHVFMGGDNQEIFPINAKKDNAVRKILMLLEENKKIPQDYMEYLLSEIKEVKMSDRENLFEFLKKGIKSFRYKCGITDAIEKDTGMGKAFMKEGHMLFMVRLAVEKTINEKSKA